MLSVDSFDFDLFVFVVVFDCFYFDEMFFGKKVVFCCVVVFKLKVVKVLLFYWGFEMLSFEIVEMVRFVKGWW